MPRPYARLRETTFDLYVERDVLPGYYKAISIVASWMVLAGYVLFAVVFSSREEDLSAKRDLLTAVASALLIVGYIGVLLVALLGRSLLFLIDGVIFPALTASLLGLFVTVANFALRLGSPTPQIYVSIPLVTACVTTVVAAITLGIAYRELKKIRHRDERRRWHVQLNPYMNGNTSPRYLPPVPGPDDEAQRRQLMRLLHDRQDVVMTPDDANKTFEISLPGESKSDRSRHVRPERESRSPARTGFRLGNLMPWRNPQSGTFKDARETRREQIERSSVSNVHETRGAQDSTHHQSPQSPAWGWPPATRYA